MTNSAATVGASPPKSVINVEVYQASSSTMALKDVKVLASKFLSSNQHRMDMSATKETFTSKDFSGDQSLLQHISFIDVLASGPMAGGAIQEAEVNYYVVKLDEHGSHTDGIEMDGEEIQAARQVILPAKELHGIWDSLIYGTGVKDKLLRYVFTAMKLSDKKVDPNLISWNRMVLLHGPPGTGKTSLCRALAQKLSVRLSDRYSYGYLVEVNSHSLFSKWFSESGKLVQKMFEHVQELIDDPCAFVCVLIDEVESLAAARKASSSEPSDAIRVVNAVLTQIDTIKQHSNVIIMTTSNITGTIDLAFVDRADIKQYIGPPTADACYAMLAGSFEELVSKGLVDLDSSNQVIPPSTATPAVKLGVSADDASNCSNSLAKRLWCEAQLCVGLSGRNLRKLPFLAMTELENFPVSGDNFLNALHNVILEQKNNLEQGI